MLLSDAFIGNLERLSSFVDAGYIKESRHDDSIKKHVTANKSIDDTFWSHVERMANLLSSGTFTATDNTEQLDAKVAHVVRDGAPQSAAARGATGVGGWKMKEARRPAQKKLKRTSKETKAAAKTKHGNIVNCWAAPTNNPEKATRHLCGEGLSLVHHRVCGRGFGYRHCH
ncbi:hypothetical protein Esi_0011_0169 [Ectocarpus siliculosus]|uniref:Uncharacterized protein n=1 Tax=Ectocarpus siliculosus TaxID=2880 RepID=D8LCR3_ECTSI|nr:hypothetical protein Esi_0011_0169 [Ectocarpus siliculosus]|eukprot:CBN79576.1 hypothetical protein Esi_0011_0169 [Ectocarpus siliculosus]